MTWDTRMLVKRRLYIYSELDRAVDRRSVEAHAADVREKGMAVTLAKWERSPHIQHMLDPNRYWNLIADLN